MITLKPTYLFRAAFDSSGNIVPGSAVPLLLQHGIIKTTDNENAFSHIVTDEFARISLTPSSEEASSATLLYGITKGVRCIGLVDQASADFCILHSEQKDNNASNWRNNFCTVASKTGIEIDKCPAKNLLLQTQHFADFKKYFGQKSCEKIEGHFQENQACNALVLPLHKILLIILPQSGMRQLVALSFRENRTGSFQDLDINGFADANEISFHINEKEKASVAGVLFINPDMQDGVYRATVRNQNSKRYPEIEVTAKVSFNIRTPMGDFGILNAMPVSVEESIFVQYPTEYEHIQSALTKNLDYPSDVKTPFQKAKNQLEQWVNTAKTVNAWNKTANNAVLARGGQVVPLLADVIGTAVQVDPTLNKAYDIYKQSEAFAQKVGELRSMWKISKTIGEFVDAADSISDFTKLVRIGQAQTVFKTYGEKVLQAALKSDNADETIKLLLCKNIDKKWEGLLGLKDVDITEYIDKDFGPPSAWGRALGYATLALSAAEMYLRVTKLFELSDSLDIEIEKMNRIAEAQEKAGIDTPSRDAYATIERARIAVDTAMQGLTKQQREVVMACVDATLGYLATIPATSAAATLVLAVKGAAESAVQIGVNALDAIEKHFPSTAIAQAYTKGRILRRLSKEQNANFSMLGRLANPRNTADMTEGAIDRLAQIRMRSEAIRGLIALIQRLSCRVYFNDSDAGIDYAKFNRKLEKYHIDEYIEEYILNDGWLMPRQSGYLPIGLDQVWLYSRGEVPDYRSTDERYMYYESSAAGGYLLGTKLRADQEVPANCWKADFQKYYPIHQIMSKSATELAQIFSQNYTGALGFLRWTQTYWRKRPAPGAELSPNEGWQPLYEAANKIQKITTDMQLRVVVIFDKTADLRAVPMSLQLHRQTLLKDIGGPIYKSAAEPLAVGEGELLETAEEKRFEGMIGCVFFPFYSFGGEIFFGPKPLKQNKQGKQKYYFTFKAGDSTQKIYFNRDFVDIKGAWNIRDFKRWTEDAARIEKFGQFAESNESECDFVLVLDDKRGLDKKMLRSETFLSSYSSDDVQPPVVTGAYGNRFGISGVLFHAGKHSEQTHASEFFAAGTYEQFGQGSNTRVRKLTDAMNPSAPLAQKAKPSYVTMLLYTTLINENEWAQSKKYVNAWTQTGCQLVMKQGNTIQECDGTLHFLGAQKMAMKENKRQFIERHAYSSVDPEKVDVMLNEARWRAIHWTAPAQRELGPLLQWGRQNSNFDNQLFGETNPLNPSVHYFAAQFKLKYLTAQGDERGGFDTRFSSNHPITMRFTGAGWNEEFHRDLILKQTYATA